jgi:hypothetical protein
MEPSINLDQVPDQATLRYCYANSAKLPGVVWIPSEALAVIGIADMEITANRATGIVCLPGGIYQEIAWWGQRTISRDKIDQRSPVDDDLLVFSSKRVFRDWCRRWSVNATSYDGADTGD